MANIAAQTFSLTTISGGINRLRTKGGASKDSLYDLLNGYITAASTARVRPGTFRVANIAAYAGAGTTKGLVRYQGNLHTFATQVVSLPPTGVLHVLAHPAQTGAANIPLKEIHFAAPFLGGIYVVAEFVVSTAIANTVGSIFHYWIQYANGGGNANNWTANTDHKVGDVVIPSTPNGLTYIASRLIPAAPLWAAGTQESVGNIVEPNTYNGFQYVCTATSGPTPATGATEPTWPTSDGGVVVESNIATQTAATTSAATDPSSPGIPPRYGGIGSLR